jgi:hypothetical protein
MLVFTTKPYHYTLPGGTKTEPVPGPLYLAESPAPRYIETESDGVGCHFEICYGRESFGFSQSSERTRQFSVKESAEEVARAFGLLPYMIGPTNLTLDDLEPLAEDYEKKAC